MTEPTTAEQHAATQAEEYGQFVAVHPIDIDGARAFNPGHPVPASHVARFDYLLTDGLVEPVGAQETTAVAVEPESPEKRATGSKQVPTVPVTPEG